MKTVKEIVDEYRNRQNKNSYESVVIKDGVYSEKFVQVTNVIESDGKIEFDYNMPIGVNFDADDLFDKKWIHKEFIGTKVRIIERTKWIDD